MSKHSNQTKHFGNTDKIKKQSDSVISSNVEWLLKSGIRIKVVMIKVRYMDGRT